MLNSKKREKIYINTTNKNWDILKTIITCIKGSGCLKEGFKKIQNKGNRKYTDLIARLGFFCVLSFQ